MEKEYKAKLDRLKVEINEMLRAHHPFGVFKKAKKNLSIPKMKATDNPYTERLIKKREFHFTFAQQAFEAVKYDMKLYEIMKENFCEFCKAVLEPVKRKLLNSKVLETENEYKYEAKED